jgi:CMP-N,N'-diacetyllegionaminic acid synthase
MSSLAIIPARIGSTGVKRKNIRPLAGRPLVEYAIEASLASRIDRVIVSTDSPEIAAVAREAGAEVPFLRPAEFADNTAPAMSVVRHCLGWLEREEGSRPDTVAYLQPTSPFRTAAHIDRALDLMTADTDSVWTMVPVAEHPYFMFVPAGNGRLRDYDETLDKPERRQDLPEVLHVNPVIMMSRTSYLLDRAGPRDLVVNRQNFRPLVIDRDAGIDINTEAEFVLADLLMRQRLDAAAANAA